MLNATYRRFDVRFDPAGLRADLERIAPGEWTLHYNSLDFNGRWDGVALRAPGGAHNALYAGFGNSCVDTPILARCPALHGVLDWFQCPLESARLLRLGAGAAIREHCDHQLGIDCGEVRIHVPVTTNPQVEFYLDGRRLMMNEGEVWYLDLSRPHRIKNRGTTDRVHLVIDCVLNDWLSALLAAAGAAADVADEPAPVLDPKGFEAFRAAVIRDPALQEPLVGVEDVEGFRALVVRLGQERGYEFDAGDVEDALRAGRRTWFERNLR